jgi:S-DNA-T family DNA segregation ATPase FtsK/SpoIIIE
VVSHRRSPLRSLAREPGVLACLGPADTHRLHELLRDQPHVTVLADDAETLHDTPVERPLLGLLHPDADGTATLALAGSTAGMSACFRGLTVEARRGRTGLLLGQVTPGDGDLFGLRLARQAGGPPGRGLLVLRGQVTPVQVARTTFAAN